jgi:hypothetical protein
MANVAKQVTGGLNFKDVLTGDINSTLANALHNQANMI